MSPFAIDDDAVVSVLAKPEPHLVRRDWSCKFCSHQNSAELDYRPGYCLTGICANCSGGTVLT